MSVVPRSSFPVLICALFLLVLGALFMGPVAAEDQLAAEVYMADVHESAWNFKGSSALCELSHEIPQFGLARFRRPAGAALSFRLEAYQPVPERIEGVLREVSPPWSHAAADTLEQIIAVDAGLQPIKLDRRPAGWLLSSLAKGQVGSFDMLDWNDSRKMRQVRLSPVNFQQSYRKFKQCLRELGGSGQKGLAGSQGSAVHFALDEDRLEKTAKAILLALAERIKADSRITAVRISGHADDQGEAPYNLRLSARRAKRVFDFLRRKGVGRKLMEMHHYGESRPKVRGYTEAARAANRRVEIELVRAPG
ncbi:MAG: OmpA family protein [Candidatus Thiodiazotropha sp.]|jgi:sodium-type flagellar protein MotY